MTQDTQTTVDHQQRFNIAVTEALGALDHAALELSKAGTAALMLDESLIVGKTITYQETIVSLSQLVCELIDFLDAIHHERVGT